MAGFDHVLHLAEYLVKLQPVSGIALTVTQEHYICYLWSKLHDFDKKRTEYPPIYQDKQNTGRFKAKTPKRGVVPGVVSTKR